MQAIRTLQLLWKANRHFWTVLLPQAWDKLPLDGKLAWVMLGTYTICLLTLLEILLLKH